MSEHPSTPAVTPSSNSAEHVARQARAAFEAASQLLSTSASADATRSSALLSIRTALEANKSRIQAANALDMQPASELVQQGKLSASLAARLDLFSKAGKWESLLAGVADVAALASPLDHVQWARRLADETETQGAIDLFRITCPIGVLLCIFEARPEVVVNIASLAIKSGNAAILKGGKESKCTAAILSSIISDALAEAGLPKDLIQTVETRSDIQSLLHLDEYIDLVIPRGSNELVKAIQRDARMPVMGHADGLCVAYVHEDADLAMVTGTVVDSKTDYPAACNALETLLVHTSLLAQPDFWPPLATALLDAHIHLRLDPLALSHLPTALLSRYSAQITPAQPSDYDTEFLDLTLAVAAVPSLDAAITHITTHSSGHTDLILTSPSASPNAAADRFVRSINSANVFVNVSTRFADGFRFGLGTEVGISTGKTHARGPVGLDGLVIYKYVARAVGGKTGAQTAGEFNTGRKWMHKEIEARYPTL
ncbi:probable PRO2-gamma-glutamyl phosphate reductase [Sporisorium reilianum SRZ2]|uniref:glutamate-5-semialdehyde dehydrogenase n=1 Tax=Sporisorium reilianum (strain SRZ2) TaxID=999809 RepID=E6ZUQ5_SPORE|nr:probable PRO2-gamma-glutamyl phosphate reductase [Sporisorium reilianum SRZ2]